MNSVRVTASALAVLVLLTVTAGCGETHTGPTAPEMSPPAVMQATEGAGYDTTFQLADPTVSPDAVVRFGRHGALAGAQVPIELTKKFAFNPDLMLAHRPEEMRLLLSIADSLEGSLKDSAGPGWTTAVKVYLTGSGRQRSDAQDTIYSLALYDLGVTLDNGTHRTTNRDGGPPAVDPKISSVHASVDGDRLAVRIRSSAVLRLSDDGAPKVGTFTRNLTFWMVHSGTDWLVDGWKGKFGLGKVRPER